MDFLHQYWSYFEVILLGVGIFVFYRVALSVISWIDKKVPSIELQEGWIRYLIDGPKSVLAIGLVSVLFGIVLLNLEASKEHIGIKLAGVLFTEFGFAFFIAFILHNTIEMHSRVEHDRQISRGIISYLYGVRVDDKMFRAAEEYIFKTAFFRKNLRVEYEFQKELLGKLFIKYTMEYVVSNISDKDQTFKVSTFVEKSADAPTAWGDGAPDLGLARISIAGVTLSNEKVAQARSVDQDDENFIQSGYNLPLKSGESVLVKTVSYLEKCARDTELWRSVYPADGVEVKFIWRSELKMQLKVEAVHPVGSFDQPPHVEEGLVEAKLSSPLFPYNGFVFWWSPSGSDCECD